MSKEIKSQTLKNQSFKPQKAKKGRVKTLPNSAESEGFKPPIPVMGIPDFESSAFGHSANFPKNYGWKLFLLIKTELSPALCEILSTTSLRDLSTTILRVLSTSSRNQSTWMRDQSTLLKEK